MGGIMRRFGGILGLVVLVGVLNLLSYVFNWGWVFY